VTSLEGANNSIVATSPKIAFPDITPEKRDFNLPCMVMPLSQNRSFYGREDILEALENALVHKQMEFAGEKGGYLRTYALCGAGGMGKTQIATEFMHRQKHAFDACFWVHADEPSKLAQSFNDIAIELGLVTPDSAAARDQILTRDLVLGWLAKPLKSYKQADRTGEEASWLLVFDNADNPEILIDSLPTDSTGSVLITSRDPLAKTSIYSQGGGMMLPPFSDQEATNFLLKMTGRIDDPREQHDGFAVANVLSCIPLAIAQMARVIARHDISFSNFLSLYQAEHARSNLLKLEIKDLKFYLNGYDHTLTSVWGLEYLKKGSTLLEILALLDADGIQEYILTDSKACHFLSDYPQSGTDYAESCAELLQSSLITREREMDKIIVHRLIQDAARAKMSDVRFDEVFSFTFCLLSAAWPYEDFGFGSEINKFERCSQLFSHIMWLQRYFPRFRPPTKLSASSLEAPKLLLGVSW
jgi:hypothetical protein